jgi:hypothetical protein
MDQPVDAAVVAPRGANADVRTRNAVESADALASDSFTCAMAMSWVWFVRRFRSGGRSASRCTGTGTLAPIPAP